MELLGTDDSWKRAGFSEKTAISWSKVEAQPEEVCMHTMNPDARGWGLFYTYKSLVRRVSLISEKRNGFIPKNWVKFTPEEAALWRGHLGRVPYKSFDWARWNFTPQEASSWLAVGVKRGHVGYLYQLSDASPDVYREWCKIAWTTSGGHEELFKTIELWKQVAGSLDGGLEAAKLHSSGRSVKPDLSLYDLALQHIKASYVDLFGSKFEKWEAHLGADLHLAYRMVNMGISLSNLDEWQKTGKSFHEMADILEPYVLAGTPINWALMNEID